MTTTKPYTIGVVGGSASGKTSFLRDLVDRLPTRASCVVSQDNYYRTLDEQQRDASGWPNFDLPTAIHRDRFYDDVCMLINGRTISRQEYTFNHRERQGELITTEPAKVIFIEGLFVFHFEEIRNLLDLRVFIDADVERCKERRLKRDAGERGYPPAEAAYQWEHHVLPAFQQYILPYRESAHLIVTNHDGYAKALEVVTHHVLAMIGQSQ